MRTLLKSIVGACLLLLIAAALPARADEYTEVASTTRVAGDHISVFGSVNNTTLAKICGDLPAGKEYVRTEWGGITPGGFARYVALGDGNNAEVYSGKRVCVRVKNWSTGDSKTFSFNSYFK
jgi:hypothetical protein